MRRAPQQPPPYSVERAALELETQIETFRASGPGGQHVNKTNSALRLVHPPSGVVVIAQDSPSQARNRELAFARLIERLRRLNYVPKKRIATKPSKGARERRLQSKKLTGKTKRARGKVIDE
jgi:ribosome-associated protein